MMIRAIIFSSLLVLVFYVSPVAAEIYKYRDAQGVVRYTYDLGEVPEDQRPGVETYEEETNTVEEKPTSTGQEGSPSVGEKESEPAEDSPPVVDEQKIEELNQKKKELDQEFASLMEAKYALIKEKERLDTLAGRDAEAVAAYDKKVKELNQKIADYQKRQEAFQEEAEAVDKALKGSENQ